jgi:hypothetical protein
MPSLIIDGHPIAELSEAEAEQLKDLATRGAGSVTRVSLEEAPSGFQSQVLSKMRSGREPQAMQASLVVRFPNGAES